MASAVERGLAQKLLYIKGRGSFVPNPLAAAARRVLDGKEQPNDTPAIRQYFNIGRSHSRGVRGGIGLAQRIGGTAMNLTRDYEMLTQGSAAAGARMVATVGLDISQEVVKNRRTLIKIGEGIAETLKVDPVLASRFINSLSRIAKVGGVVGTAIIAGFTAANHFYETLKAGSDAGQKMNRAFFEFGNRYLADRLQSTARSQLERESFKIDSRDKNIARVLSPGLGEISIDLVDEYLRAQREKATSERMGELMAYSHKSRSLVQQSSAPALIKYASDRGKALTDLTPEEINTVLDEQAIEQLSPTMDEYFSFTQEKHKELVWWERLLMNSSPHYWNVKQHQWSKEIYDKVQSRYANRLEAIARAEQDVKRKMSPTDRLQLQQARDEATSGFAAYRSRHRVVLLD